MVQPLPEIIASSILNALPEEYHMKNMFLIIGICCLFLTVIVKADDGVDITYELILKYGNHGGYEVAVLEVLQDTASLNSYLTGTGYDPSLHPPIEIPDFASETLIALITEYGGGPIHYRRTVERINESVAVITLEAVCDTLLHDISMSLQQGYNVSLVVIHRTDKSIILHEKNGLVSIKHGCQPQMFRVGVSENRNYTIQGRLLAGPIHAHGPVVGSNGVGGTMRMFMHR